MEAHQSAMLLLLVSTQRRAGTVLPLRICLPCSCFSLHTVDMLRVPVPATSRQESISIAYLNGMVEREPSSANQAFADGVTQLSWASCHSRSQSYTRLLLSRHCTGGRLALWVLNSRDAWSS